MSQPLENLEVAMAFEDWALPRGYDMTQDGGQFQNLETRAAWLGFEAAHGPAGCRPYGQQLYALIKRKSEYAHQSDKLFPVRVAAPPYDDYIVHGGIGGVYRQKDVDFYVIDDGKQYRLS
ncbi:hypothetical protein BVH03_25100 [Pseudomonas sp. PA15(2017)]|uniref:hypothetical protein n=1 Tax=Pseudomonas sp. PA15(2017) TaxID=1932111 RepID=UPI00095A65DD|nr:hypothetical protein [Pseudomonas sp. PA15(2017)]OLU22501.1 hypothetical protein BVH03_25100 [Pseudomonas sp. PA15(2017)]